MAIAGEESERIEMSRRERDRLKVLDGVLRGERPQKEAARLLGLTVRQVRRLVRRIEVLGDGGLIHRLRGRPSNRGLPAELRQKVLAAYRHCYWGFGPTLASEKLAEQGLQVSADTLRRWLMAAAAAPAGLLWGAGANGHVDPRLAGRTRRVDGADCHDR
jgi:hypothetical protein